MVTLQRVALLRHYHWLCKHVMGTISGRERVGTTQTTLSRVSPGALPHQTQQTSRPGVQEPRCGPPTPASFLAHSLRSAYIAPFGRHSKRATFSPSLLQLHTRPPTHSITPPDTQPCSSARKRSPTATPARSPPTTCPSTSTSTLPQPCIQVRMFDCIVSSFPPATCSPCRASRPHPAGAPRPRLRR